MQSYFLLDLSIPLSLVLRALLFSQAFPRPATTTPNLLVVSLTRPEVRATANEVGGSRPGTGLRSQHYHRWLDWSLNTDNMTSDHTGKNFSTCQDPVHRGLSTVIELRAWSISWPLDTSFPSPNPIYNVSSQVLTHQFHPWGLCSSFSISFLYPQSIPPFLLHSLERQCPSKRKTFSWPCILLFI